MKARGNLWASVNGSLRAILLNLSKCRGDEGGHNWVDGVCLRKGERGVSLVDSLFNEEEVGSSLFLVKKIVHSLSPILGLALFTLIFMRHGMLEEMTDACGWKTGWAFFAFFGARAFGVATFLFCRATYTKPSSSSSISLRSFNLCVIEVTTDGRVRVNATNSCILLVQCS